MNKIVKSRYIFGAKTAKQLPNLSAKGLLLMEELAELTL